MILSFNTVVTAEENMIVAGRPPDGEALEAAARADAIILPIGVREDLYRMCRAVCPRVWPNYDHRFDYPGKTGQARLFAEHSLPRPRTVVFPSAMDFDRRKGGALPKPYVLKTDSGGEGAGVFPVFTRDDQAAALSMIAGMETDGRRGFIQQEMIDSGGRDLRVTVIGDHTTAYWRCAAEGEFLANLSAGGREDFDSDPDRIEAGVDAVREFAGRAGIDMAGFDLMFDRRALEPALLFIEINWFFGRRALGGSDAFYRIVKRAAKKWLAGHGLKIGRVRSRPKYSQRD